MQERGFSCLFISLLSSEASTVHSRGGGKREGALLSPEIFQLVFKIWGTGVQVLQR